MTNRIAWGFGLMTVTADDDFLDVWYPAPQWGEAPETPTGADAEWAARLEELAGEDEARGVSLKVVTTRVDLDEPPADGMDVYFRLHLLSHRMVEPNDVNLTNLYALLPNVVHTSAGVCAIKDFEITRARLMKKFGHVTVFAIDKFPRMVDYVVPSAVRVADADRVRLGGYVGEGTTVMHEGFVNVNAGTLGVSMVEGRISMGVIVEDGADIGGGASTMGVQSGGGTIRVRVGERTLLGANSGLGIAIGADCVVESGLYLTAGSKVTMVGWGDDRDGQVLSAREMTGCSGVLFRRNSVTGAIEALPRKGEGIALNPMLHAHN